MCARNIHDSRSFFPFFKDLCRRYCFDYVVLDAQAVFPCKRPMAKRNPKMFARKEFIYADAHERCEDFRHTFVGKLLYKERKETIERPFGSAKENHGFRFTRLTGKGKMKMKAALIFGCMNLKKLVRMDEGRWRQE